MSQLWRRKVVRWSRRSAKPSTCLQPEHWQHNSTSRPQCPWAHSGLVHDDKLSPARTSTPLAEAYLTAGERSAQIGLGSKKTWPP